MIGRYRSIEKHILALQAMIEREVGEGE